MSKAMCAGWRRSAAPGSSSGSTPILGASPKDFETRAADYDAQRRERMTIRLLSTLDLEVQIAAQRCIQDGLRHFGRTLAENSARCAYFM